MDENRKGGKNRPVSIAPTRSKASTKDRSSLMPVRYFPIPTRSKKKKRRRKFIMRTRTDSHSIRGLATGPVAFL